MYTMNPFNAYIGKRFALGHASIEILRQEVRGRRTWLVGQDVATGEKRLISARALLKHVSDRQG